jgi:hypothetical protein
MREYAYELLIAAGELDDARERHLDHFLALASVSESGWPSPRAHTVIGQFEADYENIHSALEWAATSDPCGARRLFATTKDLFLMLAATDGRRLATQLLAGCPARDRDRAEVQLMAGAFGFLVADAPAARTALVEAQKLAADLGERWLEGWAHYWLGLTETFDGAIEPAREHLEATRALHDETGATSGWRRATALLGLTFLMGKDPVRARELVEEALAANVVEDDEWGQGQCNVYLGMIAEATGAEPQVMMSHYRQAVDFLRLYRGGPLLPVALVGQAGVLARDDPDRALRVAAAACALNERTGGQFSRVFQARADGVRASAEAALGAEAERIWEEGERLGVDAAIAFAFPMEGGD